MVIRDTQSSRKIDFSGCRGVFFLTFVSKMCYAIILLVCPKSGGYDIGKERF